MIALIAAIFVASLLGSMHCVGMCGAFLAFAINDAGHSSTSRSALQAAYHGGRLITYSALGALAGGIGAAMDLGGSFIGIQRVASVTAGAVMIGFGTIALMRLCGARVSRFPLPSFLQRVVAAGHRVAFDLPPVSRALTIGLLTTLLPCGWLYAFVVTAAGTAHPLYGLLTMAVFWLGTLPAMIGLGVGLQKLTGALRPRLPFVTSTLVVVAGLYMVVTRLALPTFGLPQAASSAPTISAAIERVNGLNEEEMACCHAR